jgi:hypothetical protein
MNAENYQGPFRQKGPIRDFLGKPGVMATTRIDTTRGYFEIEVASFGENRLRVF